MTIRPLKADLGLALRWTIFHPRLITSIVPKIESAFSSVWFPSIGPHFDSIDSSAIALGASRQLKAGTGVIRLGEYDLEQLSRRIETLSQGSQNRFILGVGTGSLHGGAGVNRLVELSKKLRETYLKTHDIPIYFAALGPRMVRAAFENADGVLLNFCSPRYASRVTTQAGKKRDGFQVACYLKLFFAKEGAEARRMLADEFLNYNAIPQYHKMFEAMGLASTFEAFRAKGEVIERHVTGEVSEVSMANPTREQLVELVGRFREAGVDSPVIYPYVAGEDIYRLSVIERLHDWVK